MNKNKWTKEQKTYVGVALLVGVGFVLGAKYQKKIDIKSVQKHLKNSVVLARSTKPMFPDAMPIAEIKKILESIEGAKFVDALITDVNGIQELIIRK